MPVQRPGGLSAEVLARVATTGGTVVDRSFPAHLVESPVARTGHAWSAAAFGPYRLVAGRAPAADGEIVIGGGDPALVGRPVDVTIDAGGGSYTVAGVTAAVWFEHAIFFTEATAARLCPDVNALVAYGPAHSVRRAASTGPARVLIGNARRAADPDPSGGRDQLSDAQAMAATSFILGGSLAVFVMIATFSFITEQRRRELALLRTVGATPRQVRRIVLTEAAIVGVAASAVGGAVGTLGVSSLNTWMVDHAARRAVTISAACGIRWPLTWAR